MPHGALVAVLVAVVVSLNLWVVFGVVVPRFVRTGWGTWHGAFPAREPAPGAVRRGFQSFSVGLVNLGLCVHVAVDEEFLHLSPALLARGLGLRAVSIPWSAIEMKGTFPIRQRRATIHGVTVFGPAWCLDLAGRPGPAGDGAR